MTNQGMTMTFHQMSPTLVAVSVTVLVLVLIGRTDALSPPDNISYRPKFFQQRPSEQQNVDVDEQKAPQESMDGQEGHLMKLLSMKNSLSDLLTPDQIEGLSHRASVDSQLDSNNDIAEDGVYRSLEPAAEKRVFCNGFTGCGGRFRAQRRHPGQHGTAKRVFCNSQGCRNGGRKRAMAAAAAGKFNNREGRKPVKEGMDMELWKQAMQRLEELQLGKLRGFSKRLFCNNYGGCHNVGKRRPSGPDRLRLRSGEDKTEAVGASSVLPKLGFLSDGQHRIEGKRFFSGGFDGDMDSLIDSLR